MRILVLITLANGALLDVAVAPYSGKETGEQALLRQMFETLNGGDILLGDANFENYFLLAGLMAANIDGVFEKNGSRIIDFRKCCKKLGSKDGLFRLERPACPSWMDEETYQQVSKEIIVRAIRTKKRVVVTTLTDAELYPRKEITDLYVDRWHVELDFRCIKTIMGMEILRCKTPEMLRKELYVHLLMYNLIRALMSETAKAINHKPRRLSFQDVQSQNMAVRSGFKSRSEVVSEQGYDSEQIDDEIAADNRRADDLELQYDSDGRQQTSNTNKDDKDEPQDEQETAQQK